MTQTTIHFSGFYETVPMSGDKMIGCILLLKEDGFIPIEIVVDKKSCEVAQKALRKVFPS